MNIFIVSFIVTHMRNRIIKYNDGFIDYFHAEALLIESTSCVTIYNNKLVMLSL